jgi:hypothetical protein
MRGIEEALQDHKNAVRMLEYATEQRDIDTAINLMKLADDKLRIFRNMDPRCFDELNYIEEEPTMLDRIKAKWAKKRGGEAYEVTYQKKAI